MSTWNARREAAEALLEILKEEGYATVVLDRRIQQYPPFVDSKDKALVTHLVYTTLTRLRGIDFVIDHFSKTPVRKMKPYVAATLRIAVCQLIYMDKIPARAAINEAVEGIKHSSQRGLAGFVNGVLRSIDRGAIDPDQLPGLPENPLQAAAIRWSLPDDLMQMWQQAYGTDRTLQLAKTASEKKPVCVRTNTLKTTPEALLEQLKLEFGEDAVHPSGVMPWVFYLDHAEDLASRESFRQGLMTVQDESSVLAALCVKARPGMKVLDMCAAPGGKSTCMAQTMENKGQIISCDVYEHKLARIRENAERLGITILETRQQDGTVPVPEAYGSFDAVLLDAPCSGYGILRQKPDIRLHHSLEDIPSLVDLQRRLLLQAAQYVKPGGRLVYSTCTLDPEENEKNAAWFLENVPDFTPGNLEKDLPILALCDTINSDSRVGCCTILPQPGGRDGFFIASFRKGAL